ncbi:MAG: hypothetical protein QM820_29000 [Minicystis sp.]
MPYTPETLAKHKELMTRGDDIPVTLVTHYGQRAEGHLRRLRLSEEEVGSRARKWLIICLVLAPFTFAFPPHFPWPLIAIATGLVGYYARRRAHELILGGEAHCPKCEAFQILDGGNVEFPMAHFCTECRERSLMEPSSSASGA